MEMNQNGIENNVIKVMKTLNQYINEKQQFLVKGHLKKQRKYKYIPETKDELIEAIKTELDNGNTDLNCINTSNITDMRFLFDQSDGIELTNEQQKTLDVSRWDVSNVKNMSYLFYMCRYLKGDLSKWDVSNVKDMNNMFHRCEQFNSDLSKWDVSNVKDMQSMFFNCEQFNSDLSNWNVSNVEDMYYMFFCCEQFNSDLSNWDVSNVKDMRYMFLGCKQFNSDLSNWDVSNVKRMTDMFPKSGLEGNEPAWYKK